MSASKQKIELKHVDGKISLKIDGHEIDGVTAYSVTGVRRRAAELNVTISCRDMDIEVEQDDSHTKAESGNCPSDWTPSHGTNNYAPLTPGAAGINITGHVITPFLSPFESLSGGELRVDGKDIAKSLHKYLLKRELSNGGIV